MKKSRLESFSDGVFAIVITLLVLDIRIPQVTYSSLLNGLAGLYPNIAVYVLSFLLIGMYWVFHHYAFMLMKEADGVLLWLNIIFLLFISFMPFPTRLMGEYPFRTIPVVIYGLNLLAANITGFIAVLYLNSNRQLASDLFTDQVWRVQKRIYLGVNSLYIICIALAFFIPEVSGWLFGIIALFLIIRSVIFMGIGKCRLGKG
jgi:TMEM175 potassium channel family protein